MIHFVGVSIFRIDLNRTALGCWSLTLKGFIYFYVLEPAVMDNV